MSNHINRRAILAAAVGGTAIVAIPTVATAKPKEFNIEEMELVDQEAYYARMLMKVLKRQNGGEYFYSFIDGSSSAVIMRKPIPNCRMIEALS